MQFEVVTTNSRRGASPAKAPPNDPTHANARPQSELIADNANSTSSGHTEPFVAPAQPDLFGDLRRTETAVREPPRMPNNADQRRVVLSLQPLPSGSRAGEEQAQPSADTDGGPRTLIVDAGAGALQSRAAGIHGVSAAKPEWADPTSTSAHSPQAFHAPVVVLFLFSLLIVTALSRINTHQSRCRYTEISREPTARRLQRRRAKRLS